MNSIPEARRNDDQAQRLVRKRKAVSKVPAMTVSREQLDTSGNFRRIMSRRDAEATR
jgi:hypothetical protein